MRSTTTTTPPLLDLPRILADDRLLHALTGRRREQFEHLLSAFGPALQTSRQARWRTRQQRKRPRAAFRAIRWVRHRGGGIRPNPAIVKTTTQVTDQGHVVPWKQSLVL